MTARMHLVLRYPFDGGDAVVYGTVFWGLDQAVEAARELATTLRGAGRDRFTVAALDEVYDSVLDRSILGGRRVVDRDVL